jgi:hypothetical protein
MADQPLGTSEILKKQAAISKLIDEHGPDFLRTVLDNHKPSSTSGSAPLTPQQLDPSSIPVIPDSMSGNPVSSSQRLLKLAPSLSTSGEPALTPEDLNNLPDSLEPKDTTNVDTESEAAPIPSASQDVDTFGQKLPNTIDASAELAAAKGNINSSFGSDAKSLSPNDETDHTELTQSPTIASSELNPYQAAALKSKQDWSQAHQEDSDRLLMGGLLKASQMFGKAMSRTPGQADTSYADQILSNHNLSTNALKTSLDYQGEVANQQQEQLLRNPDSAASKAAQDIYEKTTGHSGKGLPAVVIMKLLPEAAAAIYKQSQIINNQEVLKIKQGQLGINQDKADTAQQNADTNKAKSEANIANSGSKNYIRVTKELETIGRDKAVQQAGMDILSARKANAIFRQYPNLDNLPNDMTHVLTSEIAKIAQGGAPTQESMRALDNPTLKAKMAKWIGIVNNEPTSANLGAFLKNYKEYLAGMQKEAEGTITDRYNRIYDVNKKFLTPDEQNQLSKTYLNRFLQKSETPESTVAPIASTQKPSSNMVRVQTQDGKMHDIPKENLDKAIARGAKVVQ